MEKLMQTGLTLRGDFYYCPLALQLSTYWNCEATCAHCYLRRLNRTWGQDLRPLDPAVLRKQVKSDAEGREPRSPLAWAIRNRQTVYLGAKSDPYQPAELTHRSTRAALRILLKAGFSVVIATMFTEHLEDDRALLEDYRDQVTIMPIVSPGLERDWNVLERQKTTNPVHRLEHGAEWQARGFNVGINGEPFIPGFHTIDEFDHVITLLRILGLKSYNTYNLHLNDWNLKELYAVGADIERIAQENLDAFWYPVQQKLIQIAQSQGIILGCPDFVNSGSYDWGTNTCCGMNVPNPIRFNLIHWKKLAAKGVPEESILSSTFEGVGELEYGRQLLQGKVPELLSLKDIREESWI